MKDMSVMKCLNQQKLLQFYYLKWLAKHHRVILQVFLIGFKYIKQSHKIAKESSLKVCIYMHLVKNGPVLKIYTEIMLMTFYLITDLWKLFKFRISAAKRKKKKKAKSLNIVFCNHFWVINTPKETPGIFPGLKTTSCQRGHLSVANIIPTTVL